MKQGFTLVELLAVIAILVAILFVAIPKILDIVDDFRLNAFIDNETNLTKATANYMAKNPENIPLTVGETVEVTLNTLQTENYINSITDPYNHSITCDGYVTITKTNDKMEYTPQLKCGTQNTISNSTEDGLVGSWILDNNAYDYTINNHPGTLTNVTPSIDRFGKTNGAFNFNGTSSTIDLGNYAIYDLTSTGSIVVWAKSDIAYPSTDGTTIYRTLVSKSNSGGVSGNAYIVNWAGTNTTRTIRFYLVDGVSSNHVSIDNYDFSEWHQIVATWDGSYLRLYSDGIQIGEDNQTLNAQILEDSLEIGHGYTSSWWDGDIDDVRIYNRALSATEILQLYELENVR